jgi:acyl-CoA synthetase
MPEYFLEVTEIPLGATGKILKRSLLLSMERGELVPTPVRLQS